MAAPWRRDISLLFSSFSILSPADGRKRHRHVVVVVGLLLRPYGPPRRRSMCLTLGSVEEHRRGAPLSVFYTGRDLEGYPEREREFV